MFNLTYLSDEDRARLLELQDMMRGAEDVEEQRDIRQEIQDIESKRKQLNECTLEECTELRLTLFDKFDRLNRTGKYGIAIQFKQMLQAVENRMRTLHLEMMKEEQERMKARVEAAKKSARKERKDDKEGKPKSRPKSGSSRWTTGIGNLD